MTLDQMTAGQKATITAIGGQGPFAQRLMALGILEGTEITMTRKAIGGDPVEIELMGYRLSLRREEARKIEITESQEEEFEKNLENTELINELCDGIAKLTTQVSKTVSDDENPIDDEITEEDDEYAAMLSRYIQLEEEVKKENERIQHVRQMDWESDYWDEE